MTFARRPASFAQILTMLLPDYESLVPVLVTFARELVTFVALLPNCTSFRELVPLFADIRVPQELIDSDSNPPHPSQEKKRSQHASHL